MNLENYLGHSFIIIGAASTGVQCRLQDLLIKTLGLWESMAYTPYISQHPQGDTMHGLVHASGRSNGKFCAGNQKLGEQWLVQGIILYLNYYTQLVESSYLLLCCSVLMC